MVTSKGAVRCSRRADEGRARHERRLRVVSRSVDEGLDHPIGNVHDHIRNRICAVWRVDCSADRSRGSPKARHLKALKIDAALC